MPSRRISMAADLSQVQAVEKGIKQKYPDLKFSRNDSAGSTGKTKVALQGEFILLHLLRDLINIDKTIFIEHLEIISVWNYISATCAYDSRNSQFYFSRFVTLTRTVIYMCVCYVSI